MINLDCQLRWFWDQLKGKLLVTPGGISLIRLFEAGSPTVNIGGTFGGSLDKRNGHKSFVLGLLAFSAAGEFIHPVIDTCII